MKHFILIILSFMIALPSMALATENTQKSTYDRVIASGKIRCGYAMWTPVLYKDLETDTLAGIFYDLMNEVGNRLDLEIVWAEESGWGTLVEGLHTKRYDMVCSGLGHSSARAKFIDFGDAVFYTPMYAVTKIDNTHFDKTLNILNNPNYKIAVQDGELSSVTARQAFPLASIISMPQLNDYSMLLKEVETGKADVTLVEPSVFRIYEKANPGKLKILNHLDPINIFPISVGLPTGDLAFNRMINVTLQELINDKTVERILQKHEEFPEAFLRRSKAYEASK